MNPDQLLLIDLSALAHQIYHVSGSEPDPSYVSNQIVARVRALSTQHPHAAICCDAPPYLRKQIDPSYKATRPESIAPLLHQMRVAEERLAAEGYPVWKVPGYEADDIIATATRQALAIEGASVLIASADKDLLQLIGPNVAMKKITGEGETVDEDAVKAKFGVTPAQMLDYLCLVGDTSDNIIGAKGIGGVRAAALLKEHGTLAAVYEAMKVGVVKGMTPAQRSSLVEFAPRWPTVRDLITLRTDVAIPFEEIAAERTAPAMEGSEVMSDAHYDDQKTWAREATPAEAAAANADAERERELFDATMHAASAPRDRELTAAESTAALSAAFRQATNGLGQPATPGTMPTQFTPPSQTTPGEPIVMSNVGDTHVSAVHSLTAGAMREARVPASATRGELVTVPANAYAPVDFSQQLEPRSMNDARDLAQRLFDSKLFLATFGTPQAVLAVILAGRELGMGAMKSLRSFHIIESRPTMSADLIAGQVLSSGKARYFKPTGRSATAASFKTLRVGDEEEPFELVYTIEEARLAWNKDEKAWAASGWGKNPADMLVARCKSKLARLVYPDVVSGLYAPEEME